LNRLFLKDQITLSQAQDIPMRLLAHLGDAVFHLYEREREILSASSAKQMHNRVTSRVNAERQAQLLDQISPKLSPIELDIIRRARNVKAANYKKGDQSAYRKATAFEALIGYLYLTDLERLQEVLDSTLAPGLP
jgi:ribonuclease III family protein